MNNRDYWIKREEEKLNKGIKDCNKLAKELQSHYKKAYKEIEKEINNLFKKYSKDNELTYAEASKYLTSDAYLLRGDLILKDGSHVCTNITNGSKASTSTPKPSASTQSKPSGIHS